MDPNLPQNLLQLANVPAQAAPAGGGAGSSILLLVVILGIFYFLMIRPQQKQAKEHQSLLASLKKDDRVITASGIYGTIWAVKDATVLLEVARDVRIEIDKSAVRRRLSAGEAAPEEAGGDKGRKDRKG